MEIIIGIDPGLSNTGWGIINVDGNRLNYVASGTLSTSSSTRLPERLKTIYDALNAVMKKFQPSICAIEDSFVNHNPLSSLKLGQARGIAILAASHVGLSVFEYAPRLIKKGIVGSGKADKIQVSRMVKYLLPKATFSTDHESDSLAVAICHAHMATTLNKFMMKQ